MGKSTKKSNALQLYYVQFLRLFLWFIGGWPGKSLKILGEPKPHLFTMYQKYYLPFQTGLATLFQMNYLYTKTHILSFSDIGHSYINLTLTSLTLIRLLALHIKMYSELVKDFLARVHLFNYRENSEFCGKMFKKIDKLCYIYTVYSMLIMIIGLFLYNILPLYINYKNGVLSSNSNDNVEMVFSVVNEIPGFDSRDSFTGITILNWYLSIICAISICGMDALLSLMIFNLIGHIEILKHELETIPQPKKLEVVEFFDSKGELCEAPLKVYDSEENDYVYNKLTECIEHHKFIISAMKDISDYFGPILGFNYLTNLMQCCVLLLQCSQNDPTALFRFGPLTLIIFFQLIQMSVTFEYVNTVSEKLQDIVYEMPWECMNTKNRRIVYILLQRVQTPISVTAMGLTTVGVTTMTKILKATFSYFTFLRSMM